AMVNGGILVETIPSSLISVLRTAPFATVASVVAGLGERGVEGDDLKACASYIGQPAIEALPPATLLRLTVAATKSAVVSEAALDPVASAAALVLNAFTME
ncbi:unnamed protein product, partial [Polarella glacialis]